MMPFKLRDTDESTAEHITIKIKYQANNTQSYNIRETDNHQFVKIFVKHHIWTVAFKTAPN